MHPCPGEDSARIKGLLSGGTQKSQHWGTPVKNNEGKLRECVKENAQNKKRKRIGIRLVGKLLRNATKQSKRQCWKALCADVDRDSWDTPYRLVVRKLQTSQGSGAPKDVPTVDSTQDCISARMDGYIIQFHDSIRYLGVGSTGTGTLKTTSGKHRPKQGM